MVSQTTVFADLRHIVRRCACVESRSEKDQLKAGSVQYLSTQPIVALYLVKMRS